MINLCSTNKGKNLISADRGKNFYFHINIKINLVDFFTPTKSHAIIMLHKLSFISNYVIQM